MPSTTTLAEDTVSSKAWGTTGSNVVAGVSVGVTSFIGSAVGITASVNGLVDTGDVSSCGV